VGSWLFINDIGRKYGVTSAGIHPTRKTEMNDLKVSEQAMAAMRYAWVVNTCTTKRGVSGDLVV
jgi:hypothetical protein